MPPYRASLYGYRHLDAYVLPARRASLREGKFCPSGGSARKHTHMFTNIVLICICFLKETLPKRRFCPKTYPYVHKYCAHMYMFSKRNSAQAEVLPENISICPQIHAHMYMFLKETLPKRRFCL
ncbi:hypothetical protein Taro_039406 [Colocasia esculenta]|uniref:Uncharacterized protein n=1 Tax=Colocasia esculenta TaxID=4460 RepID=A0A843WAL1_COLES|nr:hypothetical protein [Colocasia esculenta]